MMSDAAQQSLYIVGIIYAVSRALLLVQYLVALYLATRAKRPRKALLISIGSCALCMATATASTCISFSTRALIIAKLVLLYGGMLVECLGVLLESSHQSTVRAPVHDLTERCGALTLIILGEGFISVLRAFQYALSGFGATDRATYVRPVKTSSFLADRATADQRLLRHCRSLLLVVLPL
jgi:low temperature requirement protein LtrA